VFTPAADRIDGVVCKILRERRIKLLLRLRRKLTWIEANEFTVDADGVRAFGLDVEVGSALGLAPREKLSETSACLNRLHSLRVALAGLGG
jgi:hypothetical protein